MDFIKTKISENLSLIIKEPVSEIFNMLAYPPEPSMGDLSFACFKFSKKLGQNPLLYSNTIKEEVLKNIDEFGFIDAVSNIGPYVNFFIDRKKLFNEIISRVIDTSNSFFKIEGEGKTVLVEYSSPNIAKPIAFHHIRSTVIGNIISNIFEHCGYTVKRINYLGDWGTQFGKLITAFEKYGDYEKLKTDGVKHLLDIYIKYHKNSNENEDLDDTSRAWFKKTEEGDLKALEYWDLFRDISLLEFKRIYSRLNINFTNFEGESFYKDVLEGTTKLVDEKIGLKFSGGAYLVDLNSFDLGVVLLKKSDGSTLYITRDIAAAMDRWKRFSFDESIYVVAHQQELHFKQFFKILELMGFTWSKKCKHVSFGLLQFEDKKMSSREGNLIFLEEVLDKAVELASVAINNKNPDLENKDEVAEQLGIGAVIFNDVSKKRIQNVNFDWKEILNFEGETAPYVQYSYARACNILKKSNFDNFISFTYKINSVTDYELEILKIISLYKQKLIESKNEYEPYVISRYVLDLCKAFNRYYYNEKILTLAEEDKIPKLFLVYAVKLTIKTCLNILGINAPERM